MTELLKQGLIITVIGMGLVFAALALLWGLMVAMQRLFPPGEKPFAGLWRRRRDQAATPVIEETPLVPIAEAQAGPTAAELAAIMTALALWREEEAAEEAIGWRLPPLLTRWLAVGRSRQLQSWSPRR
ncbi:MAG: OadG family protein [Chloroflexi bacterium]|nr:OadG family protein [Chloroflexota bacterium]